MYHPRHAKARWSHPFSAALGALALVTATMTAHAQSATPGGADATPAMVVNINTATAADLERLPGIGPSRARAILALRERLGRFRRIEQLILVRGIGRATFRKLRPLVTVQDPPDPPGPGS
jgi:competence protein ComEA